MTVGPRPLKEEDDAKKTKGSDFFDELEARPRRRPIIKVSPQAKVKDPLSDITRKERRSLLGISTIGIVIVKIGLIPEKISALGIDFTTHDQKAFLHFYALIVSFYTIAFLIYAISDFIAWRVGFIDQFRALVKERRGQESRKQNPDGFIGLDEEIAYLERRWNLVSTAISSLRAVFEFVVPLAIAIYSIVLLSFF